MSSTHKGPSLRINQDDLKCKNGCGFFGNYEWEGFCSKCHRELVQKERGKKTSHTHENAKAHSVPGFSKFEEKKRQQSDKKAKYLKQFPGFRKPSNAKDSPHSESFQRGTHSISEIKKFPVEFKLLFRDLDESIVNEIIKSIRVFTKYIETNVEKRPIDDIAEYAQNFYHKFSKHMENLSVNSETREQLLDFFEKYTMTNLYRILFCPSNTSDEEKDLAIQQRIRNLSWVNAYNLDCRISETSIEVRDLVYTSITELLNMDSVKTPQEKLICIIKCCRSVLLVLQQCQGGPVSADEFLPALIFVVLKANPARLKSNINFMTRFCNDTRLMQGEGGYYFTNLCCAVSFIENLTAESLSMTEPEFTGYMSGSLTSVSPWESALVACEGMHQLCQHLETLKSLKDRNEAIVNGTEDLKTNIEKFKQTISESVSQVISRTPFNLRGSKVPIDLDRVDSIETDLPPPIIPVVMSLTRLPTEKDEKTSDSSHPTSDKLGHNFYLQNLQLQPLNFAEKEKKGDQQTEESQEYTDTSKPDEFLAKLSELEAKNYDEVAENFFLGLSNVNYDIEFSDLSAENSNSDDYSPDKSMKHQDMVDFGDFPSTSKNISEDSLITDESDVFSINENLPSPIKPSNTEYSGFSTQGCNIPSIPCITGDLTSLPFFSDGQNDENNQK